MALKPIGSLSTPAPASAKEFAKGTPAKVLPAPRQNRIRGGEEADNYSLNVLLFGPVGTGKTRSIVGLLKAGLKVLVLVSDIGNNGLITVKLALKKEGLEHLAENYKFITLENYKDAMDFLQEPAAFWPDVYSWGVDAIVWDGFSSFQGTDLMEYVGGLIEDGNLGGKDVSELRSEGVQFSLSDYKVVRDVTIRVAKAFCKLHNKKTGQVWHHFLLCHEALKAKGDGKGGFVDSSQPFLTGSGGVYLTGAFDLIIKTQVTGTDEASRKYEYVIEGNKNLIAKNRGFSLPPSMEGDMEKLWKTIESDLGLERGAVDPTNVAPVLLAE